MLEEQAAMFEDATEEVTEKIVCDVEEKTPEEINKKLSKKELKAKAKASAKLAKFEAQKAKQQMAEGGKKMQAIMSGKIAPVEDDGGDIQLIQRHTSNGNPMGAAHSHNQGSMLGRL
jgi:hypothetical protein